MVIVYRQFRYSKSIKVSPSDFDLAVDGRKQCTIRLGTLSVAKPSMLLTDGVRTLRIDVSRVDTERVYSQLTDEDARLEGFDSLTELQSDLARYYRAIDPNQPVTVVYFQKS